MKAVPYQDNIQSQVSLTETELRIIIAFMYVNTLCFIFELAMALNNTWRFLIKQRKYKTWPLLMFYVLTICLATMRIYNSVFLFFIIVEKEIFGSLLDAILKLNIGLVQCWILFELALKETL